MSGGGRYLRSLAVLQASGRDVAGVEDATVAALVVLGTLASGGKGGAHGAWVEDSLVAATGRRFVV